MDLGRDDHDSARGDLTDRQLARLEPLLPAGKKPGRPPTWTRRQLLDGIRWRTRAGTPWRDVPERYGPWDRVYDLFRRWQRDDTWTWILEQLRVQADTQGLITGDVSVDSTICRAPSTPPTRVKQGSAARAARRDRHRARPGARQIEAPQPL
ncbi:transposase [Kitasatospora sp. NPDC017646]|uniref:transposase n=1 Tax=Kitasatospora sp. NPDC017646 TaxID=3364024 RepID=UPI003795EBC8